MSDNDQKQINLDDLPEALRDQIRDHRTERFYKVETSMNWRACGF